MRLCFLHIPKTGGAALHEVLLQRLGQPMPGHLEPMLPALSPDEYRYVHGHFRLDRIAPLWTGEFFTLVREPVARIISLYNFLCSTGKPQINRMRLREHPCRSPALDAYAADSERMICLARRLPFDDFIRLDRSAFPGVLSWPTMLSFLPARGDAAAYADRFLFVGLTERMAETGQRLCHALGLTPGEVPRSNVTTGKFISRADLSPADLACIRERCRFEFDLYDEARRRFDLTDFRCQS